LPARAGKNCWSERKRELNKKSQSLWQRFENEGVRVALNRDPANFTNKGGENPSAGSLGGKTKSKGKAWGTNREKIFGCLGDNPDVGVWGKKKRDTYCRVWERGLPGGRGWGVTPGTARGGNEPAFARWWGG